MLVSLDPGGHLSAFEKKTIDVRHRYYAKPSAFTDSIVILSITDSVKTLSLTTVAGRGQDVYEMVDNRYPRHRP